MTEINQHFKLTKQEFYESSPLFNTLKIREEQVVDQNYQYLSEYLKKQYNKLLLVNHSDKGGNDLDVIKLSKLIESLQNTLSL